MFLGWAEPYRKSRSQASFFLACFFTLRQQGGVERQCHILFSCERRLSCFSPPLPSTSPPASAVGGDHADSYICGGYGGLQALCETGWDRRHALTESDGIRTSSQSLRSF